MESIPTGEDQVTFSDILDLASWNRPRSSDELASFVLSRHDNLPDFDDIDIL